MTNTFDNDYNSSRSATSHRSNFVRRHRGWLIAFASIVLVMVLAVSGFAWMLNNSISEIGRVPVSLDPHSRPQPSANDSLDILLLGADAGTKRNGPGTSIIKDAQATHWPQGKYRSDATMLLHISADRKQAFVISIPRDSYVSLYDQTGQKRAGQKVNAALSLYGPSGAISTVENFTGRRIDHAAMLDWDGFEDITDALGGVEVAIPGKGSIDLDGKGALGYVRERHHLPEGDFDRVRRQQNFLRAVMSKMVSKGTLTHPVKLTKTVKSVAKNMAVDDGWSTSDMRSLAWAMRHMRTGDITFLTVPIKGTKDDPQDGSIDIVDKTGCDDLFQALDDDNVDGFIRDYPETSLDKPGHIR